MPNQEDNKIPESHIKVGNFLWYSGQTSVSYWDCPAEIIMVNDLNRTFKVKSLDDMEDQSQPYSFDVHEHSPASRINMRVPTRDELRNYLSAIIARQTRTVLQMRHALAAEEATLSRIEQYRGRFYSQEASHHGQIS